MKRQIAHALCILMMTLLLGACQTEQVPPTPTATAVPTQSDSRAPYITVAPDQVHSGDAITVVGADWPANATIALELRPEDATLGAPVSLGNTSADSQGRFKFVSITPIQLSAGRWSVAAHGGSPAGA